MAKTAKLKSKAATTHASNPRSRASKRATSPSIDLDKSLKTAPRQEGIPTVLAPHPNSGVVKSSSGRKKNSSTKRGNARTKSQKVRQERGLQKAEAVMGKLERKREAKGGREQTVRERRKEWGEVNGVARNELEKEVRKVRGVGEKGEENLGKTGGEGQWEDIDGEEDEEEEEEEGGGDGDEEMQVENEVNGAVVADEKTTAAGPAVAEQNRESDGTAGANNDEDDDEDKIT